MKTPFPRTEQELAEAGYEYENSSKCRGCGAAIAWYLGPSGKRIALDEGTLERHWENCPNPDWFL